jgi:hypothetical protein
VLVEPSATGHRVRFRTVKADARGLISAGVAMMAVSAVIVLTTMLVSSADSATIASSTTVGAIGAAVAAAGGLALPGWLRRRRAQMAELAAKLLRD